MATAKRNTSSKTKKPALKKPVAKKAPAKTTPPNKSSILSYARPKEFNTTPVTPNQPDVVSEVLSAGTTGMVYEPPEIRAPADQPVSAQDDTSIPANPATASTISEPAIISGEPLPSSVLLPGETAEDFNTASSITLPPSVKNIQRRQRIKRLLAVAAATLLIAGAGFWYFVYRQADSAAENQQLIQQVSRLALVPQGETPSVTTVVDEQKVNQEFLRSAKKGDKVLLYFQAGRAVVYRPDTGQIINMGPLETPKPRVFLRNGSTQDKLPRVAEKIGQSSDFLVASRDNSPKQTYTQTIVVDVAGNRPDVAQRLARFLGATVATLPDGESRPDSDLLVLVGSDYQQ